MTTTAAPAIPVADPTPIPFDLFREVHKGLRHALFALVTDVGAADLESADERHTIAARVRSVIGLLRHHHAHEDAFIQPVIEHHDAGLAVTVDDGHAETDREIALIGADIERLAEATGSDAVVAGLDLYRRLALFTAGYLAHMALEEGAVMTTLRAAMTDRELLGLEMELRGAIVPPVMCEFIAVMVPPMNRRERTAMLGGMHAGAPPEIFELFRAAAEDALDARAYRILAADLGIA
jgi:hypothetical protein